MAKLKQAKAVGDEILDFITRTVGDRPALKGQPAVANIPNVGPVRIGGSSEIESVAREVARETGIPYTPTTTYVQPNQRFATAVADEYGLMALFPNASATHLTLRLAVHLTLNKILSVSKDCINNLR